MWADGPEAGRSPPTSVASRQSSIVGPEYGLQSPLTPNALCPSAEGSQGRAGVEEARTHTLTAPSEGPAAPPPALGSDTGRYPLSTVPQSCSCSQAAGLAVPLPRGAFVHLPSPPPL